MAAWARPTLQKKRVCDSKFTAAFVLSCEFYVALSGLWDGVHRTQGVALGYYMLPLWGVIEFRFLSEAGSLGYTSRHGHSQTNTNMYGQNGPAGRINKLKLGFRVEYAALTGRGVCGIYTLS